MVTLTGYPVEYITLTLALSLAGMASADVYKCPAPGGTTIYQDAPCSDTAVQPHTTTRPPTQVTPGEQDCYGLAAIAYTITLARMQAAPLGTMLAQVRTSFHGQDIPAERVTLLRDALQELAVQIYEQPWLTPIQVKSLAEARCLRALQAPAGVLR